MTFEEIKAKIEACASVSITEIKEIQYGKCICLNNGGKINCFNTGKYTVQGKAQEQTKAILESSSASKIEAVTSDMKKHEKRTLSNTLRRICFVSARVVRQEQLTALSGVLSEMSKSLEAGENVEAVCLAADRKLIKLVSTSEWILR